MEHEALARMKIEQSLRLAILEKRFCCAFQPRSTSAPRRSRASRRWSGCATTKASSRRRALSSSGRRARPDRRAHAPGPGRDRQIDRPDQRDLRPRHHDQHQCGRQAGVNPEFMHSFALALEATGFPKRFMIEVTEDAFVTKTHFQEENPPAASEARRRHFRSTISASAIRPCRRWPTSPPTRSRSTAPSSRTFTSARAARASCGDRVAERSARHDRDRGGHRNRSRSWPTCRPQPRIRYAQGYYFARPIFLEELRPAAPLASESRSSLASRPVQQNRVAYSRGSRYRR